MAVFHLRWIMEAMARKSPTAVLIANASEVLRTGVNGIPASAERRLLGRNQTWPICILQDAVRF
jgi:hypothetical protein